MEPAWKGDRERERKQTKKLTIRHPNIKVFKNAGKAIEHSRHFIWWFLSNIISSCCIVLSCPGPKKKYSRQDAHLFEKQKKKKTRPPHSFFVLHKETTQSLMEGSSGMSKRLWVLLIVSPPHLAAFTILSGLRSESIPPPLFFASPTHP